jgi:hypothetical protein
MSRRWGGGRDWLHRNWGFSHTCIGRPDDQRGAQCDGCQQRRANARKRVLQRGLFCRWCSGRKRGTEARSRALNRRLQQRTGARLAQYMLERSASDR